MSSIYLIEQVRSPDTTRMKNPIMYGLTREKDLAKEFMDTRRNDLFRLQKIKLTKTEAFNMLDNHHESVLFKDTLTTTVNERKKKIQLVMTQSETMKVVIKAERFWGQLGLFTKPEVFILDEKFLKALDSLGYFIAMKNISPDVGGIDRVTDIEYRMELYGDFFSNYSTDLHDFIFDEFQIFLYYYGWSMMNRNKGGKEIAYDYIIPR